MGLLKLVPSWAYAAAIACLLFLNVTGHFREASLKVKLSEVKVELAKEQVTVASLITNIETANRKAAEDTAFLVKKAANAVAEGKKREDALRVAKSKSDDELAGLRDATMSARSSYRLTGFTPSPSSIVADTALGLLETCSREYLNLAYSAQAHANDLQVILAAWPTLPVTTTTAPPK